MASLPAEKTGLESRGGSLQQRAARLLETKIDYIPHESFHACDTSQLSCLEQLLFSSDSSQQSPESQRTRESQRTPEGLPPHLSRLCETELLSADDEVKLFRQMNHAKFLADQLRSKINAIEPDREILESVERLLQLATQIRDHIIKANMRLVMSIVKKMATPAQPFDELLSEGTVTLMQAVEKFDFDRGFRFSTYAYRSISRTAYRFVANAREEESRLTRDADEWAFGECTADEQSATMSDHLWNGLRELTSTMLAKLDRRERFIIRSRYALGSHRRVRSFQDLGNRLGVSKERVRQIEARAVAKLQAMAKEFDIDEMRLSIS